MAQHKQGTSLQGIAAPPGDDWDPAFAPVPGSPRRYANDDHDDLGAFGRDFGFGQPDRREAPTTPGAR